MQKEDQVENKKTSDLEIISEVAEYSGIKVYLISPGILVTECTKDVHLDLEKILHLHELGKKLSAGTSRPHLFISVPGLTTTKDAREWGSTEEANEFNLATAIMVKSLGQTILGNFFVNIQRPPRPTKLFTKREQAIEWLKTFL